MIAKTFNEFDKVLTGKLAQVVLTPKKNAEKPTLFSVILIVEEDGKKIPYQTRPKTVEQESQEQFTIDQVLAQVGEYDLENKLTNIALKMKKASEYIGSEVQVKMVAQKYTTYTEDGTAVERDGYDIIFDPSRF